MQIKDSDKEYLLSLKPEDLSFKTLVSLFGQTTTIGQRNSSSFSISKPRFETTDTMVLKPSEYFVNKETLTTVGRFIYNKFVIERSGLQKVTGYVNTVLTDSGNGSLEKIITAALLDEKITVDDFVKYIDARDTLGLQLNSVITTSFTPLTIVTPKEIQKKKKALFTQYKKELDAGDIYTAEKIEKELSDDAKRILKGDKGLDLYASEARGNFGNYKNMLIFKGATYDASKGKYDIVTSSFMDGMKPKDLGSQGRAVVSGAYPKAIGTAESGYLSKQLTGCMQSESLDKHGTDCGTKHTLEVEITAKNKNMYIYRYIVDNGKLVCLTPDVLNKYVGKTVKLRSPMFCKGDKICNICAGEADYKLGNINIGLGCSNISTKLLRMGMKKFHTSNISSKPIDLDDILI